MTNIVVLIKQVPDTWSERKLTDGDFTLDREAADAGAGVVRKARLAVLAVIDDIDAGLGLPAHHVGHRSAHGGRERFVVMGQP